ncbi:hypothetical protein [Sphingomonas crusticola]|uniref:hypothetical protein n=1 Tax=Sphingomonas crusticola TaxID=1697973 RepID=UPI000E23DC01|nr:hypothetical protein [Sphingomonas crusticola]
MTDVSNDNASRVPSEAQREPDAHGQSAMLLVESLIHGLVARSSISVEDAVEIVSVAIDAKEATGAELGDTQATLEKSLHILGAVRASLSLDLSRN